MKEELEKMWGVKASVIPVVVGVLGAETPGKAGKMAPTNPRNNI